MEMPTFRPTSTVMEDMEPKIRKRRLSKTIKHVLQNILIHCKYSASCSGLRVFSKYFHVAQFNDICFRLRRMEQSKAPPMSLKELDTMTVVTIFPIYYSLLIHPSTMSQSLPAGGQNCSYCICIRQPFYLLVWESCFPLSGWVEFIIFSCLRSRRIVCLFLLISAWAACKMHFQMPWFIAFPAFFIVLSIWIV